MKPSLTSQSNCLSSQPGFPLSSLLLDFFAALLALCIYPACGLIYLFTVQVLAGMAVTWEEDLHSPFTAEPRAELGASHAGYTLEILAGQITQRTLHMWGCWRALLTEAVLKHICFQRPEAGYGSSNRTHLEHQTTSPALSAGDTELSVSWERECTEQPAIKSDNH